MNGGAAGNIPVCRSDPETRTAAAGACGSRADEARNGYRVRRFPEERFDFAEEDIAGALLRVEEVRAQAIDHLARPSKPFAYRRTENRRRKVHRMHGAEIKAGYGPL